MQNYHKHTYYSNIFTPDSAASYEDYAKRCIELGHKVLSSVDHGWQSYYYETYEMAKKYNLKFIFGTEAYWVKDRSEKDRTNGHIVILAKNETGRRAINRILSDANESGYYYKPRVDIELLLSLPPDDVFVTTACIAFWQYAEIDEIIMQLHNHFKDNLMLEVQYHLTDKQRIINKYILNLSEKYGIDIIVGMDSHYIYPEQEKERTYVLEAKGIHYDEEDGWFMDYPDDETTKNRFIKQGILNSEQIKRAMDNTDIVLSFEDIVLNNDIKLPTVYPNNTQEEKNKIYSRLITAKFKEYMKNIPESEYDRYYEGVKNEVDVIKKTGMADYFLFDYAIVKKAEELGGIITNSGRGSGVGYFTNTLLGFSKVDRFTSPIKLYPERFISESRILETRSLPDLDMNCGNPEVFAEAQEQILGKGHAYPMIAFGTFKKKSAFKLFARAKNLDFEIANEISKQIEQYDEAEKYADDDEKEDLSIYDFVDEKYHDYITQSKPYWGVISDKKKAPCGYLLYQGNIREEIGLIKCKSESTKKEYITTVIDGAIAENYKFLKNDLLKVDVVLLIDLIYKRIKMKPHTVNQLMEIVKDNEKIWDIYKYGYTIGVNQVEKDSTKKKAMEYQPKNISELSAFIAGIRPAFKSMYSKFKSREPFSYGIKAFDNLIQTKEFPQSFILYQEQTMNTLNYAGFPIDQCYGIIKAIAKKHPEKVRPLKSKFIEGFKEKIKEGVNVTDIEATEMSEKVWQIISDSCGYGFNSAHAFCMALDSLYCAYLKAYYPYEFYEVLLQVYSDKGKKDKVAELKQEMTKAFNIKEGKFEWGADNRKFVADKKNMVIYSSLLSIKGLSQKCADDLYSLSQKQKFDNFYDLLKALKKIKSLDSSKINTLVEIGYFDEFGSITKIKNFIKCVDDLYERTQFNKENLNENYKKYITEYSEQTDKLYRNFDYDRSLREIWDTLDNKDIPMNERIKYELDHLGYIQTIIPNLSPEYAFVTEIEIKFTNPKITLYRLCNGEVEIVKAKIKQFEDNAFEKGDIIKTLECSEEKKWFKDSNNEWVQKDETEKILKKWVMVR
jgi:DNA polymerase III alpha subunit